VKDSEGPHLLAREREDLDVVATSLREGSRVVAFLVTGSDAARAAALSYLRERSGVELPEPTALTEGYQTLDALAEAASRPPGEVRSFSIAHDATDVLRTLNWHREKLRRGASVLVWIDGLDGLRALRATAPDAYSFRDLMAVIRGEEPVPLIPAEPEPLELQLARMHYIGGRSPIERAEAAMHLTSLLRIHGSADDVRRTALEALASIPANTYQMVEAALARAHLYLMLTVNQDGRLAQAWRFAQAGLAELASIDLPESSSLRTVLLATSPSPFHADDTSAMRALREIHHVEEGSAHYVQVLFTAASSFAQRGHCKRAYELLNNALAVPDLSVSNKAVALQRLGNLDLVVGKIAAAEEQYQTACTLSRDAGMGTSSPALHLATCMYAKGEHEHAKRILSDIIALPASTLDARFRSMLLLARIQCAEGDIAQCFTSLCSLLRDTASSARDGHLYNTASTYTECLRNADGVGNLSPADLATAHVQLEVVEDVALSIAGDSPPWYTILYPGLRSELLALCPERLNDAIELARTALDRARSKWTDAAPMIARALVAHLIRASRFDEALLTLADAEPEAEANRHLRELARLRALAINALGRTAAPQSTVDAKLASLQATLNEISAPRITATTLLDLALALPPSSLSPDPLALLDEAVALFMEMPSPLDEARCLEAMGDILAARGDAATARRRYLAANGTYERFGLGLRIPLVTSKLKALGS
jgi:tetratricopeptide (TPR) repeat protein